MLASQSVRRYTGDSKAVIDDFRIAIRSRFVDKAEERLVREGKGQFGIWTAGQELAQIASVRPLRPGDWERGYYRSGAGALKLGTVTVRQMFAQLFGTTVEGRDPSSGGRMMSRHFGTRLRDGAGDEIDLMRQINRASDVSATGSQMPVAFGLARASKVFRDTPALAPLTRLSDGGNEVVLVSVGDGSLAEGVAYEVIAQAVVQRVPLIISALDNGYSISVPVAGQVPHGSISKALLGFRGQSPHSGLQIVGPVEGWDYPAVCTAYESAYEYVRTARHPALVHAMVTQPLGHSSSGDHRRYKTQERLEFEERYDCLARMRQWMADEGIASIDELREIEREERAYVAAEEAAAWSDYRQPIVELGRSALTALRELLLAAPAALRDAAAQIAQLEKWVENEFNEAGAARHQVLTSVERVMSEARLTSTRNGVGMSPRMRAAYEALLRFRDDIAGHAREDYSSHVYADEAHSPCHAAFVAPAFNDPPREDTQSHIISAGIATMMSGDPRIVVYGEDAGVLGGVHTCTLGLVDGGARAKEKAELWNRAFALHRYLPENGFGSARVWDHAVAESTIVGGAVGLALRGLRPIAEIQYHDYVVWALQQMVDEVASLRYRTDGGQACPLLIRTHGHQLLGMWHSGSPMGMVLASCPGLRVLVPRNGVQAVAMYRAVMEGADPAFSVEPLMTWDRKERFPDNLEHVRLPLGHSEVLREGGGVTIVTYGYCCAVALAAAKELETHGIDVEVVDLQTLNPLDLNGAAAASIRKTQYVLFLDEDVPEGATAIVAKALLHDRGCWEHVENVAFVTAPHHKPPYGKDGRFFTKPQPRDVVAAILRMFDETQPGNRRSL